MVHNHGLCTQTHSVLVVLCLNFMHRVTGKMCFNKADVVDLSLTEPAYVTVSLIFSG